jgi:dephospho-CoA kinase
LAAQWPIEHKANRADRVIWTNGSLADTEREADRLASELLAL